MGGIQVMSVLWVMCTMHGAICRRFYPVMVALRNCVKGIVLCWYLFVSIQAVFNLKKKKNKSGTHFIINCRPQPFF